jgi:hypothetical protein
MPVNASQSHQGQSRSMKVNQGQSKPIKVNQGQSRPIKVNHSHGGDDDSFDEPKMGLFWTTLRNLFESKIPQGAQHPPCAVSSSDPNSRAKKEIERQGPNPQLRRW